MVLTPAGCLRRSNAELHVPRPYRQDSPFVCLAAKGGEIVPEIQRPDGNSVAATTQSERVSRPGVNDSPRVIPLNHPRRAYRAFRRIGRNALCSVPLLAMTPPLSIIAVPPSRSVTVPPASRTKTMPAAMSHGLMWCSQ